MALDRPVGCTVVDRKAYIGERIVVLAAEAQWSVALAAVIEHIVVGIGVGTVGDTVDSPVGYIGVDMMAYIVEHIEVVEARAVGIGCSSPDR
jgi:hypothetical protein